ncbi:hypothetical protein OKW76_03565 [Sphingomonas sp. S1-29]|uniref:hypothetical protein n=1 Tax=Sphingomonas sp. S1-29 TaxID=2991074 RepID=UPI0022400BE5|nr:hypothetical protein [Sphingomonas sp. S1-29]UZK70144.1 hypothetical protein OKW76_03565 [Sphingomonas sp. S1-29]
MNGGSTIIGLRAERDPAPEESVLPLDHESIYLGEETGEPARRDTPWPAIVAGVALLGWFAFAAWLLFDGAAAALPPVALVQLIAALCVPPALIAILYLLSTRNGRAEARRFGATAHAMRVEAASLEVRIAALSDRIEGNRAALNEQAHAMIAAGEEASERLQHVSNLVVRDVASVHAAARTLGESSDTAGKRLAVLIATMPRANGELQSMAETLDRLGLAAGEQVSALDAQLGALAERGRVADEVTGNAAQRLAAHIARMEATSESAGARLEAVTADTSAAVDAVLDRAAQAIDEARRGIAAQGDAMMAMLTTNQATLDRVGREGMETLAARLATVEEAIGRIAVVLDRERDHADLLFDTLDTNVASATAQLDLLHETGVRRAGSLAQSVATVSVGLDAMRDSMQAGNIVAAATIERAEGLLTALDAAVREIDETLPQALARLDARVGESRAIVGAAKPELLALVNAAASTHDAIDAINTTVGAQRDTLVALSAALVEALGTGSERIDGIQQAIESTIAQTRDFADDAAPRLVEALVRIRETAGAATEHARTSLASVIPEAATRLETASVQALARAIDEAVTRQLGLLGQAADDAVRAANRASAQVGEQMASIVEATARIDDRIEEARSERETADRDSFGRRVSLLIEALNSASIDIARALSSDVSDTAWSAYLKGDRGVFTRRAVKLIEPGQLREIANLYDSDDDFRDQVNRYIHDFEAMLRQVLAHRDGSPLGVTLLSSDAGKLYVALAQAIERLRA